MRITNKMMTNNMLSNINKNKYNMTALEQQYSTGKKIQRPSDDPIITVRALKLRTNLSELEQYYEKNIPDAMSWMEVTESALRTVNDILRQINTYCVQGSSDTLTANDRAAIVQNLEQMKAQIYQEGNTNYAGRYVFTGYKTDSPLIFNEDTEHLHYEITENFTGDQIQMRSKVVGSYELSDLETVPPVTFDEPPQLVDTYRIQLAYDNLEQDGLDSIHYAKSIAGGEPVWQAPLPVTSVSITEFDENTMDPNEAYFIHETGEVILGANVYEELRTADNIQLTYEKTKFKNGELKPEHYFNSIMTDTLKPEQEPIEYTKTKQQIQYEVNYNQKLTINTEGSDAITHGIGRTIDDILNSVNEVIATEGKIEEINKRLQDQNLTDADRQRYERMLEQLDTELDLKNEVMQRAFEKGNAGSSEEQDRVNIAVADLGSRLVRLELTENRLSSQKVDFEELLSKNEDADMVDTVIKYNAAQTIYNASLSAAAKVVQNSLLDFL
ncbi:flagellar hook-associated protein FlgL [Mobilitalea sibirica]|uniref:Flagellar hook-associated protein FlgL n=1 Tax=Mobilitalea sibirica TaxID=1462919 RepID=A0A8J7H4M0_9FIRM|nr:flagellar hook-associated protein FlgL [Mobilitalea sibirica]MBH1942463.1 flagellar hook-associated protein FlgL [Mobilitalea sibirica]